MGRDTYVMHGLAIINPYGGVWTGEIFQTKEAAMLHLTDYWKGNNDRLGEYKLAVATMTITLDREPGEPIFIPLPQL